MKQHTSSITDHLEGNEQAKNNFAGREIFLSPDRSKVCHLQQEMLLAANDLLAPRCRTGMRRAPKSPAGTANTPIPQRTASIQITKTTRLHLPQGTVSAHAIGRSRRPISPKPVGIHT